MKFGGIFKKGEAKKADQKTKEQEMALILRNTNIKLRGLYDDNGLILHEELLRARNYQKKGIKNQDNYAKIGIAYYSMLLINRALERIDEMRSSQAIYNCLNDLNEALNNINGANRKMGKVSARKTASYAKKMVNSSGGSSGDLKKTLDTLSRQEEKMPGIEAKNTGVDKLVSVEMIERLIDGEDVEECVSLGEGIDLDSDNSMGSFSDLTDIMKNMSGGGASLVGEDDEVDMEKMKELLDSM